MPAGPSEVLVIADENAVPEFCAADLLSQAEHGSDSQVIFLSIDEKILNETLLETQKQLEALPRNEMAAESLKNSHFILLNSIDEALKFSNLYAPEHLILAVNDFENYTPKIQNAGSVFLGNYSCEITRAEPITLFRRMVLRKIIAVFLLTVLLRKLLSRICRNRD
jgi:histidinol dehydrogenase